MLFYKSPIHCASGSALSPLRIPVVAIGPDHEPVLRRFAISHPCTVCCRQTVMWCSRCQRAWYCSQEHLQSVSHPLPVSLVTIMTLIPACRTGRVTEESALPIPDVLSVPQMVIQTPPPAPEPMTVSAIFFQPNQGVHFSTRARVPRWFQTTTSRRFLERPQIISINCHRHASLTRARALPPRQRLLPDSVPGSMVLTQVLTASLSASRCISSSVLWLSRAARPQIAPYIALLRVQLRAMARSGRCSQIHGSRRQSYSDAGTNDLPALSAYFLSFE